MKVSKEHHTKPAVGIIREGQNPMGGFLYEEPSCQKLELQSRVKSRMQSVQRTYNIFSPVQAGTPPTEPVRKEYTDEARYNLAFENYEIKKANYDSRESFESKWKNVNDSISRILFFRGNVSESYYIFRGLPNVNLEIGENEIEAFVAVSTRKSLREEREGLVALLRNCGKKQISESDKKSIEQFLNKLKEDYNRFSGNETNKKKKEYIRSIENQNLVVQPKDNAFLQPVPSNKDKKTEYKQNEKDSFNKLLNDYALLDTEARMEILRKIRRIVDLYFAAPKNYKKGDKVSVPEQVECSKFNVWSKHEQGKTGDDYFVPIPEELTARKALNSVVKKNITIKFREDIRQRNISCYHHAMNVISKEVENGTDSIFFEDSETNKFFIRHISNAIERILHTNRNDKSECSFEKRIEDEMVTVKLKTAYLREKIWKDILNYLSVKYIAIGKMVYNFGMNDLYNEGEPYKSDHDICLGTINDSQLQKGLNSFDLEIIKTKETLQRELAVYVMFAANNLARATVKISRSETESMTDILLYSKVDLRNQRIHSNDEDTLKDILQFFGGKSQWDSDTFNAYGEDYAISLLYDLKTCIFELRNNYFHFTTARPDNGGWEEDVISSMFAHEIERCFSIIKNTIYSNNLPMFYDEEDLRNLMNVLYKKEAPRASQIPAFKKVFVRNKFPLFLKNCLNYDVQFNDNDVRDKWQSGLYFLLQEVYYNLFIQSQAAKRYFLQAKESLREQATPNSKDYYSVREFCARINALNEHSMSEICQEIMTEYNYQNNQRKVRTGKDSPFEKTLYKNYPLLLNKCLASAFAEFIKQDTRFSFLANPTERPMLDKASFLSDWKTDKYNSLTELVKGNTFLQAWYITSRFLSRRMLNLLVGSMRSYIQYFDSVSRRAEATFNSLHKVDNGMKAKILDAIKVVEMGITLSSFESNDLLDYFTDEAEYKTYLKKFVGEYDLSYGEVFINQGGVPILNRNVLTAKLFAPDSVLEHCVPKVTQKEVKDYSADKQTICNYRVKGRCETESEQKTLLDYQKLRNKVELQTLSEYGELINDLLGQLVNWSFLRERDLFYFQLGFHYMCLQNSSEKPAMYSDITISRNNVQYKISNAILYQLAALNIYGLKLYAPDAEDMNGRLKGNSGQYGAKINPFFRYSDIMTGQNGQEKSIYNAGLELFENLNEHKNITDLRNYIDHFGYYTTASDKNGFSILDMYSEIFDRFFTYDMKYQKTVVNNLDNILRKRNIITNFLIATSKKKKEVGEETKEQKNRAGIEITKFASDNFTYGFGTETAQMELRTAAKNKEYLETVIKILNFPEEEYRKTRFEVSEDKVTGEKESEKKKDDTDRQSEEKSKSEKGKKNKDSKVTAPKEESQPFGTSMASLLKNIKL